MVGCVGEFIERANMKVDVKEVMAHMLNCLYPVGCYFETSDADFDPNVSFGGTWVLEDGGRVHISSGKNIANTTNFWGSYPAGANDFPIGERGGEPSHVLTIDQMPSHNHGVGLHEYGTTTGSALPWNYSGSRGEYPSGYDMILNKGGGLGHNNMQPYTVINRWHRTA